MSLDILFFFCEFLIKIEWLKEKSGKKVGDVIKVSKEMAEHLVKKKDVKYVDEPKKTPPRGLSDQEFEGLAPKGSKKKEIRKEDIKEIKTNTKTYWERIGKELFSLGTHKERKEFLPIIAMFIFKLPLQIQ